MARPSKLQYPTTKELAERIEALEQQLGAVQAQANNNESLIQLILSALLSVVRWAYAWCKQQKSEQRMANFLALGNALKEAIATIEPRF